jgi:tRNA A-37 threonylcarbamoyl transferase component Bud32
MPDSIAAGTDPLLGASVGSFRIQRLLGLGGMGAVYLAEHPVIGNKVAIKFLHDSLAQDPDTVWRFYQEARAAHVVGHENIVSIYDLNLLPPKRYYMVMEYLEGETLSQRLQHGAMPVETALRVLIQLCDALEAAHAAGVVHRDLKPDNIFLVDRRGQKDFVKLVDFGIAKLREGGSARSTTRVGMLIGTPEYMSPEQCEGRPVDARSDLYALGIIAFRLATGRLPFQPPNLTAMLIAQIQQPPPAPRSIEPSVDERLEQVILKALAKAPEDRFQSAGSFGVALASVLEDLRARHRRDDERNHPKPGAPYDWTDAPTAVQGTPAVALEAEVRAGLEPARKLRARHLSSKAVFLCDEGEAPRMFSRLRVTLTGAAGPVTLEADVVRHVSAAQARTFASEPGFAVQFIAPEPSEAAALEALVASLTPQPDDVAEALLARYRAQTSHYELLDLPWDVEFADVGSRGGCVRRDLEALRSRKLLPEQAAETEATLARVAAAVATLSSMEKRMAYDGELGNFPGVARAVAAGLPALRLDEARARFREAHPDVDQRVEVHLCRVRLARALGNREAIAREYEQALRLDPLNRALHEAYVAARAAR